MKFGQLIESNMKNIFLEKSYPECGGETDHRLFFKKLFLWIKKAFLWINSLKFYTVCFYYMPS